MNKFIIFLVFFGTVLLTSPSYAETVYFEDNFDGTAVDSSKWNIDHMLSGNRWCNASDTWVALETWPCAGLLLSPPYGAVSVSSGEVKFSSSKNKVFPFVITGPTARVSPFPATGNFSIEMRLRYDFIGGHGNGFRIVNVDETDPSGNNYPGENSGAGSPIFLVWADYATGVRAWCSGEAVAIPEPTDSHLYRLDYINGAYSLYLDNSLIAGPTENAMRPNAMWFGHPRAITESGASWTEQAIDYIKVTDALPPSDHLAISNYKLANIHHKSDRFSIWMDASVRGEARTDFCETHTMYVLGEEGKRAILKDCDLPGDAVSTLANSKRYRVEFEIDQDDDYPTAAYIENGIVTACETATSTCQNLTGLDGLSVYGTTFDMKEDAWEFANKDWGKIKGSSDTFKYADTIAEYISEQNPLDRSDFWKAVGDEDKSTGLCHGLASSAIANFAHPSDANVWGEGDLADWKNDIIGHWSGSYNRALHPYKPYESGKNIHDLSWKGSSAKKIMYYHVIFPNWSGDNWVGKDDPSTFITLEGRAEEDTFIDSILKKGRPGLMTFSLESGGDHSLAITQLLRYNNHTKYMIWDNENPYKKYFSGNNGPYKEWYIDDNGNYRDSMSFRDGKHIGLTDKQTGKRGEQFHTFKEGVFPYISSVPGCGDSQNIYNLWDEECPGNLNSSSGVARTHATTMASAASIMSVLPSHLEVMLIGGTVDGVYDQATGRQITLVPDGDIEDGSAVIQSSMGGTYHLLFLPADNTFRVEAIKDADMPFLKVFVTIPGTDGTAQQLNYEHGEISENHATHVSFIVGRDNTALAMQRTGSSDYPPDYNDTADMTLDPPAGFSGYYLDGGPPMLSWDNSEHSDFSLTHIVRRIDRFPTAYDDGVQVYSGAAEIANDSTAPAGSVCYYAAYSVDTTGNYSEGVHTAVDTTLFAITGFVQDGATANGIYGAELQLRDNGGSVLATAHTRKEGSYVLANLENGAYTVTAEKFGYTFSSSPQTVVINNLNQIANFSGTGVPSLELVFDFAEVHIRDKAQVTWKYSNISDGGLIKVEKISGGKATNLGEVPASDGYLLWDVAGPVADDVTLKVSLKTNTSVADTDDLQILPEQPSGSSSFSWPMFLPAIIGDQQ